MTIKLSRKVILLFISGCYVIVGCNLSSTLACEHLNIKFAAL